jgi:2,4'-dihydroxyacetophenone dioxygenase
MGENSEVIFDVMGSIEFFNDDNTLRETMDGFSFWRMYEEHCEKHGKKPNEKLWY